MDPYATLGVARNAREATIKKRYRRLVMECHPDKHPDDPDAVARFKEIHEAFECLSDPDKRAYFDRTGEMPSTVPDKGDGEVLAVLSETLHKILREMINLGSDPEKIDMAKAVRDGMGRDIEKLRANLTKLGRIKAKIEATANRLRGGKGVLASVTRAPLNEICGIIAEDEHQLDLRERARIMIADESFDFEGAVAAAEWPPKRRHFAFPSWESSTNG